jgi:hypothetical protein
MGSDTSSPMEVNTSHYTILFKDLTNVNLGNNHYKMLVVKRRVFKSFSYLPAKGRKNSLATQSNYYANL